MLFFTQTLIAEFFLSKLSIAIELALTGHFSFFQKMRKYEYWQSSSIFWLAKVLQKDGRGKIKLRMYF